MPRSFDMVAEYGASVEQVHRAFRDRGYWLARLATSGVDIYSLDAVVDDGRGGLNFSATQTVWAPKLPAVVTQLHRGDLVAVREEHWGPIVDGRASGSLRGRIKGAPLNIVGDAALRPLGAGARLELRATIEVRVPLLGGKVEAMIGQQMQNLLRMERTFTDEWITDGPSARAQ